MTRSNKKNVPASDISVAVSNVLGTVPTLPGESDSEYRYGLQSLIEELEAKTVLQVYIAEKIFECLWWMRRYEQQKRATLAREMGSLLNPNPNYSLKMNATEANNMEIVLDPSRQNEFQKLLKKSVYTEQSLMQEAFDKKAAHIAALNNQITTLAKSLSGFQASYEVLTNRKLNSERLRLQNELLGKDLSAIELEA